ncbi:MAG: 16S rRNA (guanine(966)-N(2))-methyltransferase RsmD [Oxalobacter sp.]|jgi:16S rRNA (guanine(966)-N(2))-methyltransferase RsmD|nr:MAG: 16S rRNA (guanine(966)-N(2))-methyltransferase RsmD [Oxalobacter sp.]
MKPRQTVKNSRAKAGASKQRSHQVRIIGGAWKRSVLPVAAVEGLRPTPDRVRETVFNWLNHLMDGAWSGLACLDLFAGTGALGFEAASRGAAETVLVESSPVAARHLNAIKEKLHADKVSVVQGDAPVVAARMAANGKQFDIIFLDPPYRQGWIERTLPTCVGLLKQDGVIYAESSAPLTGFHEGEMPEWLRPWEVIRQDRAGAVHYYLLKMAE